MKRFRNCVIDKNIAHAIVQAEKLLDIDSPMIKHLQSKNDWRYDSGTSGEVICKLLEERDPINVYTYRPWNPFTKAIGYFDGKAIHLNVKVIENFDYDKVVGLILHEYAHYCGFHHGNNFKTEEKCKYSVPYYLSDNVTKWA